MRDVPVESALRRRYAAARARLQAPPAKPAPPQPLRHPPDLLAQPVACDAIIAHVCAFYGVSHLELRSPQRGAPVLRARMVVIHLARTLTMRSLPAIGGRVGRSHSAVHHAARRIAGALTRDAALAREVAELARRIAVREPPSGPRRGRPACCPFCGRPRMDGDNDA